jgi:type 1 glutamine amidotransferase
MPCRLSSRFVAILVLSCAAAATAAEEPSSPARFLAVSVTTGYRHKSIETAEAVLEKLARESGLYHLDFLRMPPGDKEDPAWQAQLASQFAKAFDPAVLADFDGVMFVSTTGELPVPDLEGFLAWLRAGHAFVGFHAASDTFKSSDAFTEMVGGHFAGHPWTAGKEHGFVVHEPDHPLSSMFAPRFRWQDEIYQYDGRYVPDNLRVLVSLDMAASRPREPWHVPVSWVRDYGQGRVFYTNFGHNDATWNDPAFQKHATEGIAWAIGRFDAPAAPNPEVQAAEYVRSVIAAAPGVTDEERASLAAAAEARIAADPTWAVGLRPMLLELRDLESTDRTAVYDRVIAAIRD